MKIPCPFCNLDNSRVLAANAQALAVYDVFPISPGHTLIIPKRHIASFFELSAEEQGAMLALLAEMRQILQNERNPDGFNIGINDGTDLIPRYAGDQPDPRGGVRWIFPDKAAYWD